MPSIAEMLIGNSMNTKPVEIDLAGGIQAGAGLAMKAQQVQQQAEQIAQQKQELQIKKAGAITETINTAAALKDKNMKNYIMQKVLPAKINALGMGEFFTPQTLEMIQTSDEAQRKVLGLQLELNNKVQKGEMTGAEAYAYAQQKLSDPEQFALLDTDQLFDAQKFANSAENKEQNAKIVSGGQFARQAQQQQFTDRQADQNIERQATLDLKKKVNADFAKFQSGGGEAAAQNKLSKLKEVYENLKNNKLQTGTAGIFAATQAPGIGGDAALAKINPAVKAAQDAVRSGVNLKGQMDSQFGDKAMNEAFARAFDPNLPTKANEKKVKAMIDELEADVRNKSSQFQEYGLGGGKKAQAPPAADKAAGFRQMLEKYKSDPEKAKKIKAAAKAAGFEL